MVIDWPVTQERSPCAAYDLLMHGAVSQDVDLWDGSTPASGFRMSAIRR